MACGLICCAHLDISKFCPWFCFILINVLSLQQNSGEVGLNYDHVLFLHMNKNRIKDELAILELSLILRQKQSGTQVSIIKANAHLSIIVWYFNIINPLYSNQQSGLLVLSLKLIQFFFYPPQSFGYVENLIWII